jgi:lipoprotein-anchoring transpeptidase ErfK/SrfK
MLRFERTSNPVDRIEVDKNRPTVKTFGRSNGLSRFFPAIVGSDEKPFPNGTLKVTGVSLDPRHHYNPKYQFKGINSKESFRIKPGPNNPVGTVWINLSADGYPPASVQTERSTRIHDGRRDVT